MGMGTLPVDLEMLTVDSNMGDPDINITEAELSKSSMSSVGNTGIIQSPDKVLDAVTQSAKKYYTDIRAILRDPQQKIWEAAGITDKGVSKKNKVIRPLAGITSRLQNSFGTFTNPGWVDPSDKFASSGFTKRANFITTSVTISSSERVQVFQTWVNPHVLVFGAGPTEIAIQGLLLNTADYQWLSFFEWDYKNIWSPYPVYGKKRNTLQFKIDNIEFTDVVILGFNMGLTSDAPNTVSFSLSAVVLKWSVIEHNDLVITPSVDKENEWTSFDPAYYPRYKGLDPLDAASAKWYSTLSGVMSTASSYMDQYKNFIERITFDRAIGRPVGAEWSEAGIDRYPPPKLMELGDIVRNPGDLRGDELYDESYDLAMLNILQNVQMGAHLQQAAWYAKLSIRKLGAQTMDSFIALHDNVALFKASDFMHTTMPALGQATSVALITMGTLATSMADGALKQSLMGIASGGLSAAYLGEQALLAKVRASTYGTSFSDEFNRDQNQIDNAASEQLAAVKINEIAENLGNIKGYGGDSSEPVDWYRDMFYNQLGAPRGSVVQPLSWINSYQSITSPIPSTDSLGVIMPSAATQITMQELARPTSSTIVDGESDSAFFSVTLGDVEFSACTRSIG